MKTVSIFSQYFEQKHENNGVMIKASSKYTYFAPLNLVVMLNTT